MKKVVSDIFWAHNVPMEGYCNYPYPDVKGLISTGVGNLVDPVQYMTPLPWKHKDGTPATKWEIEAEFKRLKAMAIGPDGKPTKDCLRGGGWWKDKATLQLSEQAIRDLVASKLRTMVSYFKGRVGEKVWDSYPADAQLAILSMCWALGPAFNFPKFMAHLKARNWLGCADECKMQEAGNPGVIPRNKKNRSLFLNAAAVEKYGMDPEKLYYPKELDINRPPEPEATEAKTCPTCNGTGRIT
jgi:GH24 family phage-related lysozyme (muramidase)